MPLSPANQTKPWRSTRTSWIELLVSPGRGPIASNTGSAAGGSSAVVGSAEAGRWQVATATAAASSARSSKVKSRVAWAWGCLEQCTLHACLSASKVRAPSRPVQCRHGASMAALAMIAPRPRPVRGGPRMSSTSSDRVTGKPPRRNEDPRLLTGRALFVDDLQLPGMLHVAFLRSPYAHARILSIDTGAARAMNGVHAVLTAEDLGDYWQPGPLLGPPPPGAGTAFHQRCQVPR